MHRTEGANHSSNRFVDGPPGTTVGAAILNAIQEEIANVIEEAGITLKTASTDTRDQLAVAISDFVDKTKYGVDAEATDNYVITRSPAPTVLYDGMVVSFKANTINTGAATLNDTSLGAKDIRKNYNEVLITGDIAAGQIITVRYDATNGWYQVQTGVQTVDNTVYGAAWNGVTDKAPSKDAVYDKMNVIDKAIIGDATAGRVLRRLLIAIVDGTNAASIEVTGTNLFNASAIGVEDNLTAGADTGNFALSANGDHLSIQASGLDGNCVGAIGVEIESNASLVDLSAHSTNNGNDLQVRFKNATTGAIENLTTLVDAGGGIGNISVWVTYLTAS